MNKKLRTGFGELAFSPQFKCPKSLVPPSVIIPKPSIYGIFTLLQHINIHPENHCVVLQGFIFAVHVSLQGVPTLTLQSTPMYVLECGMTTGMGHSPGGLNATMPDTK